MLDPIGVQVLQLDPIVVQQTLEERVRRNRKSTLVEERKGNDIAVGWHRRILAARRKPLHHVGPPMENTMLDKAHQVCIGNIRAIPRINGGRRWL